MAKRGVVGGLIHKPTQKQEVLAYMRNYGSITSFEAYEELGITQLGARIYELKKSGYSIGTIKRERIGRRTGKTVHFKEYYLNETKEVAK